MALKKGARILAIDDSYFRKSDKDALIVGVVGRENEIEGILSFRVSVDGSDATEKIIRKVRASKFSDQIRLVVLHGISLAGLNIVDVIKVSKDLRMPVVNVVRKKPQGKELEKALKASNVREFSKRIAKLRKLNGKLNLWKADGFYYQSIGLDKKEIVAFGQSMVRLLRLAHLIANGIARGESKGRI